MSRIPSPSLILYCLYTEFYLPLQPSLGHMTHHPWKDHSPQEKGASEIAMRQIYKAKSPAYAKITNRKMSHSDTTAFYLAAPRSHISRSASRMHFAGSEDRLSLCLRLLRRQLRRQPLIGELENQGRFNLAVKDWQARFRSAQ